jgi:hypothetical protein
MELQSSRPAVVPGRACGSCMMCCKVPYIEEFDKPPGVWCRHAVPGKGCGIYGHHPASCQAFYCLWMQDASFGPEWKPDRAKFVVYVQQNGVNLQIAVDPAFPDAWTKRPYYARIKRWAKEGEERGQFVFVRIGRRLIAVLPDQDTEIGEVGNTDDILISRKPGPAGFNYSIEVKRRQPSKAPAAPPAI